jgi:hypothetical protein
MGIVMNSPMPMKRSRVVARQAMMSGKVARIPDPGITPPGTARNCQRIKSAGKRFSPHQAA